MLPAPRSSRRRWRSAPRAPRGGLLDIARNRSRMEFRHQRHRRAACGSSLPIINVPYCSKKSRKELSCVFFATIVSKCRLRVRSFTTMGLSLRGIFMARSSVGQRRNGGSGAEDSAESRQETGSPGVRVAGGSDDARFQPAGDRGRADAVVLFRRRHPEQSGDDHLHRLQRAGRPRDRRAADRHAGTGRDASPAPRSSPTRAGRTWPGAWGRSRGSTAPA